MEIRVYMPKEFIIKAGCNDEKFYFILDGDALMVGMDDNLIGILSSGSHFSCNIGNSQQYMGRQIIHLVSMSLTTIGVVSKSNIGLLFQAFPEWKQLIEKLNEFVLQKAKTNLESYSSQVNHLDKNDEVVTIIQDHLAFSDNDNYYKKIIAKMDDPQNQYLYDSQTDEYKKMNILNQQISLLQNQSLSKFERSPGKKMKKRTSSQSVLQFNLALNQIRASEDSKQKELENNSKQRCVCLRLNFPRWRLFVEFLQLINLIYISFAVPFSIAFLSEYNLKFTIFESISICFQWFYILVKFRTPVIYIGGSTMKFKRVFLHYLRHGLITDLLGALPLNLIFCGIINVQGLGILIGIIRLTRMAAVIRLNELYENMQIHLKNHSIKIVSFKSFLIFYFVWHITSSLWYFVNMMESDLYPLTWAKQFKMTERPITERYIMSLYFVIKIVTGLGQSDMIAYNDLERICFIIIINLGDAVFAITFGLIAQVQMHISENSQFQKYVQKMKEIETFLNFVNAQPSQRLRIEQYYSYENYLRNKRHVLQQSDLEGFLPYSVLREVIFEIQKETLEPMFKNFNSENLIRELSFVMRTSIYMAGDFIITKGQEGEEMFFIIEGQVSVIGDQGTIFKTLSKNAYFGEVAIFMKIKRTASVQAKTPCILGILKRSDIESILANYPKVAAEFIKEANRRIKEIHKMNEEKLSVNSKMTPNQSFGTDKDFLHDSREDAISHPENVDQSFVEALHNKIENIVETQSNYTELTNQSLMKKMKMKSVQVQGMNEFAKKERVKLEKKRSTLRNFGSSSNLDSDIPNFNNDSSPAFGRREQVRSEEQFPHQLFTKTSHSENVSPSQFNKAMQPRIVIEEELQDLDLNSKNSDMKSHNSISNDSEAHVEPSPQILKKYMATPKNLDNNWAASDQEIEIKDIDSSFEQIKPRNLGNLGAHLHINEDQKFTSSPLQSRHEKDGQEDVELILPLADLEQNVQSNPVPVRVRSKNNSSKIIQYSRHSSQNELATESQNIFRRQSAKVLTAPSQDFALLPKFSPISSNLSQQEQLKRLSKEYQDLLFKHVMSTIQEDDEAAYDYHSIDELSGRGGVNQTPPKFKRQQTSVRIKPTKFKKPKRRLSKIQMGRNLMLNESSGLQLQWTVGGGQQMSAPHNFMF